MFHAFCHVFRTVVLNLTLNNIDNELGNYIFVHVLNTKFNKNIVHNTNKI